MSQRSNSMPISRSIQGKEFSWPIATSTSSHGIWVCGSPVGTRLRRPRASYSASTFSNRTPVSLPLSWVNSTGTRKLRIGMPSCIASSFSQGEAFISSKPERTTTVTSSPPSRRDERQQSIAVLPPPSTMTRRPMWSIWPNDTEDSQSMPIWILAAASWRPGISSSRPRGAPEPTNTASQPSASRSLQAVDEMAVTGLDPELDDAVDLLVGDRFRAGGSAGSGCASCRRPWRRRRTSRIRSRAAPGRARRSARPGRRRPARCACRSSARGGCGR